MQNLNTTLLPRRKDYILFEALSFEAMLAIGKGYACTVATMLRFIEVNNLNRPKYEGLVKELQSTRAYAATALVREEASGD